MSGSMPAIDTVATYFGLPRCYWLLDRTRDFLKLWRCYQHAAGEAGACGRSRKQVARDLLTLFFEYRTFPDHYGPCRLWELDRSRWKYYYGSNYRTHQKLRLARQVQPPEYAILFDDKDVCDRLCRALGVAVPRSHGVIEPAQDYRAMIRRWLAASAGNGLFVKPLRGSAGRGIVWVQQVAAEVRVRTRGGVVPLDVFRLEGPAVVQDAVQQDARMAVFSSGSVNTVRVLTLFTLAGEAMLVSAAYRVGVGDAYVDNWSAGGLVVGLDAGTGALKPYAYDKEGCRYVAHPTSGRVFEGFVVPQWRQIADLALKVQSGFPCYRLLGLDIALQANGEPTVIEINNEPDLMLQEQACGPLLENEAVLREFGGYDILVNQHQRALYEQLAKRG